MKKIWYILIAIAVTAIIVIVTSCSKRKQVIPQPNYVKLERTIDSLNNEVNILKLQRDSITYSIKSSEVKIITNNHYYEKKLVDISNQPVASDVQFFTNYLSETSK